MEIFIRHNLRIWTSVDSRISQIPDFEFHTFMTLELRRFMTPDLHRFAISRLRGFMIADLRRFATSRLHGFMVLDLLRFATSRLCMFMIPDLHRFNQPKTDTIFTRKSLTRLSFLNIT
jgi:hypothetical protein